MGSAGAWVPSLFRWQSLLSAAPESTLSWCRVVSACTRQRQDNPRQTPRLVPPTAGTCCTRVGRSFVTTGTSGLPHHIAMTLHWAQLTDANATARRAPTNSEFFQLVQGLIKYFANDLLSQISLLSIHFLDYYWLGLFNEWEQYLPWRNTFSTQCNYHSAVLSSIINTE